MTRFLPLTLSLAVLLGGATPTAASPSDARAASGRLLRGVQVRRGVQHRSLVVVALVARAAGDDEPGPAPATAGLAWEPAEGRIAVSGADAQEDRLLPTGTLLREGPRERVLAHPLSVPVGRRVLGAGPRVPSGLPVEDGTARTFAGLAGSEARHVVTIAPHPDALGELLVFEQVLAGLAPTDVPGPLAAIRAAPRVAPARNEAAQALAPLATAYGGETRGYVAFLGHRPIEVVVAGTAALHEGRFREAVDGLATHLVLWEELYGRTGDPVDAVAWPEVLPVAAALLDGLSKATVRRTDDDRRWLLRTREAPRLGWLQQGGSGQAVLVEAWPLGDAGPFPVPARKPGGKRIDERPGDILQGAMTREYLERFIERLKEIRRRLGLR